MKLILLLATAAVACVHAPNIVVVDRATALEMEAAGSYPKLERELEAAAIGGRPAPLSRQQLEAAGQPRPAVDEAESSDAERVDELLVIQCLGEAVSGSLVETQSTCAIKSVPHLGTILERANRDRVQIWEWLRTEQPRRSADEVRRAWREVHLQSLPCGAQIQLPNGRWDRKKC
jgi:hypothetical protein